MHISKKEKIPEKRWINIVNSNEYLIPLHKYYQSPNEVYDSAILNIDNKTFGALAWDWEQGRLEIEVKARYLPKVYEALEKIASELGGQFYFKKNEVFDSKKHLPLPSIEISRAKKYFEDHDLDYIRWMAFREEDRTSILKELKLEESKEIYLKDGVDGGDLIVTPSYSGWTIIIGDDLTSLLIDGDESTPEEAPARLCKSIQKLSKKFIEVHYFEHQGKSNIDGYFKAKNGKLIFGYWKSEMEEFIKGRVSKEIKKLHPTSAHEIASVWSIDPLDFMYIKEMEEQKAIVVVRT